MGSTARRETPSDVLSEELERLGEKIELASSLIRDLREERNGLSIKCEGFHRERQRAFEAAGASDTASLLRVLDRIRQLEEENRVFLKEREEVRLRLGVVIEKVDLLGGDS
ncbi:MAG: hypothetical protein KAY24_18075 [Candidatus Eisenbacteria sp.]|nr:hypothetical protein [Candidatus Eisenbacteria bacterium]